MMQIYKILFNTAIFGYKKIYPNHLITRIQTSFREV